MRATPLIARALLCLTLIALPAAWSPASACVEAAAQADACRQATASDVSGSATSTATRVDTEPVAGVPPRLRAESSTPLRATIAAIGTPVVATPDRARRTAVAAARAARPASAPAIYLRNCAFLC